MSRLKHNKSGFAADDLAWSPKRTPYPQTHGLVLIDSSPIRRKACRDCEQARAQYTSATAEWERYRTRDAPEFSRALTRCAGPLREELSAMLPQYQKLACLLDEVAREVMLTGDDPDECLARIEARAEEPDVLDSEAAPDAEPDDGDAHGKGGSDGQDDDGASGDDYEELLRRMAGQAPQGSKPRPENKRTSRLKALYRELVRMLHPDQGGHMTPGRMRLWHEVQEAYRKGDLARLEVLHSKSGLVTDLTSATTPVSRIMSITALFNKSLRDLKRQMRKALADPAWGFSSLPEKEQNRALRKTAALLRADVTLVKHKILELEAQLEEIRNPSRRARRGRGSSKRVLTDDGVAGMFD